MKKVLIVLLISALLLPCFLSGCNLSDKPEQTTPTGTNPPVTNPEGKTIKLTTVKVTAGETSSEAFAAAELLAYLSKQGITQAEDGFPISIAIDSTINDNGFKIEASLEENVGMTIKGGNERGVLYAVYRFLEKYAGVRYFTPELETVYPGDVIIPDGVVLEHTSPIALDRRLSWNYMGHDAEWCVKNGVSGCNVAIDEMHGGVSSNYGPFFVHTIAPLTNTTYPHPTYATNPCLTDPEIFAMVIENLRKELEKNPAINIVSVSQADYEQSCYCPNCAKIAEENGGNYSGVWIQFVNRVAEELEADYPDLIIDTLAYKNTQSPPTQVKPRHNVCVRLCSINCCFTHPISDTSCSKSKKFRDDLVGWGKICDNIHIWDYTTNFHYYISTFANLFTIRENMRFYAENNVVSMFPQGNSQGASGEFGELRAYLLAKLMWNPYMTEEEYYALMDEFLEAYYGAGWEYVRKFIDKTTELAANGGFNINKDETEGAPVCGQGIYGHPLTAITRQEYLDHEALFEEWWNKAEEMAGDRLEFVQRSMMQWRLTKLFLHPDVAEAQKLIDDAKAAGVVWKEGQFNVQPESDLTRSPYYWKYGK